ncbi:hypothetical protein BH23CHL8_BH23CHL8_32130 [soil metagenome]
MTARCRRGDPVATPTEKIAYRIRALWAIGGRPYLDAWCRIGKNPSYVGTGLGFRRSRKDDFRYLRGPCIDCHVPYPVQELDPERRCIVCASDAPDTPATDMEIYGVDLAHERALHRERMREREHGIRPDLGPKRTPLCNSAAQSRNAL